MLQVNPLLKKNQETAAKHQNDCSARQANPITANADAWGRLIGPHNIAPIRLNGLETMVLLDTGAQIFSISKQWVEDLGLPLYELENIADIEQVGGSILDYEGFTEVTITSDQISGLELNILLLVVPYIPYHDQVPITLGTLTLKDIMEVLENTPTVSPSWKYVQQSLELTEKLESNRVATAQGKQGIWMLIFPDRENTGNLVILIFTQGKLWQHRENFDCLVCVYVYCVYMMCGVYTQGSI